MEADYILIRFGELTTKGKNRKLFTQKLLKNTKEVLHAYASLSYELQYDRMYIILHGHDHKEVCDKVKNIFGIYSFSVAYKVEKDLLKVSEIISTLVNNSLAKSFKIKTKRSDKSYPKVSDTINREIASYVFEHATHPIEVSMKHPSILVTVEIRKDAFYVMDNVQKGAGGYPVGIGGRALLMLSGGIDSPVAGYLTMKRGVGLSCIHFAAPPYTSVQAKQKVLDIATQLHNYAGSKIAVYIIPFTKLQLAIYDHCDESYAITIMRRMMYRIAQRVAQKVGCEIIVNGECVGQVASQTLPSMQVINEVVTMPVLRPVACLDKLEIIDISQRIQTYDISIRPHEDCCTIFTPKSPVTKPKSYKAQSYEKKFDFEPLLEECIASMETIIISRDNLQGKEFF